jgi:CspA family cold shock protein
LGAITEECIARRQTEERRSKKDMKNMSTVISPSEVVDERFIGRVEWFSERKGYGFIGWQGDKDVFVHRSAILGQGHKVLQEGQRVEFGVRRAPKGPEAINVIELPKGGEQAIDHPEHTSRVSRGQAHRAKRHQRDSDSTSTKTGLFVYSYTIQKGDRDRRRFLSKTRLI